MKKLVLTTLLAFAQAVTIFAQQIIIQPSSASTSSPPTGQHAAGSVQGGSQIPENAAWLPMGQGLPGEVMKAATFKGDLYVSQELLNQNRNYRAMISRWRNGQWEDIAKCYSNGRSILFMEHNGWLYANTYTSSPQQSHFLSRWDGTTWESFDLPERNYGTIFCGTAFQGDLYLGGNFEDAFGSASSGNIVRWDGKTLHPVGGGVDNRDEMGGRDSNNTQVHSMMEYKGKLFVSGIFSHVGGTKMPFLAVWNGSSWEKPPGPGYPEDIMDEMCIYNDALYMYSESTWSGIPGFLYKWDGVSWERFTTHPLIHVSAMTVYNDKLYFTGRHAGSANIVSWDGTTWQSYEPFEGSTRDSRVYGGALIKHDNSLVFAGDFYSFRGTPLNNIARLCREGECGSISGSIYLDKDRDCIHGSTDSLLGRRTLMIEPGPIYVSTNASGNYTVQVLPGAYTVSLMPFSHWNQTCPPSSLPRPATVRNGDEKIDGIDFAAEAIPGIQDVRLGITGTRARPGQRLEYFITYENIGTVPVDGRIIVTYDPRISVYRSQPMSDRNNTGTLEWDFTGLLAGESRTIQVVMDIPPTMERGEVLCASTAADINDHHPPMFLTDDRDSICIPVTGSYDPNDISVLANGVDGNGYISQTDSLLTYTIRFQNTGNDVAFRVIVVDTLSPDHDPASVRPIVASHPCTFTLGGAGVLTWVFDDIMLPDSTTSEIESHGVLKYSVRLRRNLPPGTHIPNRAQIYFDYNVPVATNTVVSTISAPLGVDYASSEATARITPNPSSGMLTIDAPLREGTEIMVLDMLGRRLIAKPAQEGRMHTLDIGALPAGTYLITLPTTTGMEVRQIVLTR